MAGDLKKDVVLAEEGVDGVVVEFAAIVGAQRTDWEGELGSDVGMKIEKGR